MQINFFKFSKSQIARLKKNIFSNLTMEFFQVITQVLFPPLMILFWCIDNFGVWIFLTSIPNLLLMFNFNFTIASTQEMTRFHSKGQMFKVNETFQNSFILTLLNISIFTIAIFLFYFLFNFDFAAAKNLEANELNLILLFLFCSFYFDAFSGILISGLYFQGKQYIVVNIRTVLDFILRLAIIVIGIFFESLLYAGLCMFVFSILRIVFLFYYFIINNKYLIFSLKKISLKTTLRLFKLSIGHTVELVSATLKHSGIIVLLGIFFNSQIIAYVFTCKTLFYFFPQRIFGLLIRVSHYEYALTFAKNKFSDLKHNHKQHIILTFVLIIILLIGSTTIGPFIYRLWLNNKFDLSFIFLLLLIFDVSIYALRSSFLILLSSLNKNFTANIIELIIICAAMLIAYYLLLLGYSFISSFIVILVSTLITFIVTIFFTNRFYKNLSS